MVGCDVGNLYPNSCFCREKVEIPNPTCRKSLPKTGKTGEMGRETKFRLPGILYAGADEYKDQRRNRRIGDADFRFKQLCVFGVALVYTLEKFLSVFNIFRMGVDLIHQPVFLPCSRARQPVFRVTLKAFYHQFTFALIVLLLGCFHVASFLYIYRPFVYDYYSIEL